MRLGSKANAIAKAGGGAYKANNAKGYGGYNIAPTTPRPKQGSGFRRSPHTRAKNHALMGKIGKSISNFAGRIGASVDTVDNVNDPASAASMVRRSIKKPPTDPKSLKF